MFKENKIYCSAKYMYIDISSQLCTLFISIHNILLIIFEFLWWLGLYKTVSWQMIIKDLMKYCLFDTRLRWSVKLYSSWFLYIVMWITKHKIHRPKILIQNLPVKQTVKEKWSTITFLTSLQITIHCVSQQRF